MRGVKGLKGGVEIEILLWVPYGYLTKIWPKGDDDDKLLRLRIPKE
jgi:hypothetical protein